MRTIPISLLILSCTGTSPGGIPKGTRLVTGQLVAPTAAEIGGSQGTPAFQLAGVKDSHTMFFGEPFDPTRQPGGDTTLPFRIALPCDQTVSLHFQRLGNSAGNQLGVVVALVQFPLNASGSKTTSLLAWEKDCATDAGREIELGTVKIDFGTRRAVLPGDTGGSNPLSEVITLRGSGQTMSNYDNDDDDGDGIPDAMDPDEDGDGVEDAMEGLQSFMQL